MVKSEALQGEKNPAYVDEDFHDFMLRLILTPQDRQLLSPKRKAVEQRLTRQTAPGERDQGRMKAIFEGGFCHPATSFLNWDFSHKGGLPPSSPALVLLVQGQLISRQCAEEKRMQNWTFPALLPPLPTMRP